MMRDICRALAAPVLLLFAASCAPVDAPAKDRSAEYPPWRELARLFGKEKTSPEVKAFVAKWKLSETTKGPSGMFSPRNSSYTIMYNRNLVGTIVIDVQPPPKGCGAPHWTEYRSALPFGLAASDRRAEIIRKLGRPTQPTGDTWHCRKLKVWAHFGRTGGELEALYISPVEPPWAKLPPLPDWEHEEPINAPNGPDDESEVGEVELTPGK